jgi:hypothetical protein
VSASSNTKLGRGWASSRVARKKRKVKAKCPEWTCFCFCFSPLSRMLYILRTNMENPESKERKTLNIATQLEGWRGSRRSLAR